MEEENSLAISSVDNELSELELALILSKADSFEKPKKRNDMKYFKQQWEDYLSNSPIKLGTPIISLEPTLKNFWNPPMARKQEKSNNNKHKNQYENQYFDRNNKSENLNSIINQTQDKHLEIALAMSTADEKEENMREDFQEQNSCRVSQEFYNPEFPEKERLRLMDKKYQNELAMMKNNENMKVEVQQQNLQTIFKQTEDKHLELALAMSAADVKETNDDFQEIKSYREEQNFQSKLTSETGRFKQINKKYENSITNQTGNRQLEIALAISSTDDKEEAMREDFQEQNSYRVSQNFHNHLISENERLRLMNKKYENELAMMKNNENMRVETEIENINLRRRIIQQVKVCMNDLHLKPYKEAILCIKLWRDCYNISLVPRKKLDHIFDDENDLEVNETSIIILEICNFLEKIDEDCKLSFFKYIRPYITVISRICSELSTRYLFDSNEHTVDITVDSLHPVFLKEFERVQIKRDGNCLWNSISFAMFGDYSKMESLRLLTAAALIQYKDYFVGHLNEQINKFGYRHGLTYEQLIDASLELSIWGDEYHLLALSLALHRPIVSYGSFAHISNLREDMSYEEMKTEYEKEDQINHMLYVGDSHDKHKYPICIYYNGENHYCAILPRNTDVMPPIPKTQLFQTVQEFSKSDTTSSLNSQRYMNSHSRADENLKRNGSRFSEKSDKKFDSKVGRSITRNEIRESKPK